MTLPGWDDVRFFLAVAKAGTLTAAAQTLGVDQSTVGRRIAAFEESLGGALFKRTPAGYTLTRAGHRIVRAADAMADAASEVEACVAGLDLRNLGTVRVETTDTLADHFVVPALSKLRLEEPGIDVVLTTGWPRVNLLRGDADVAVRLVRPSDSRLVARSLGTFALRLYASRGYVERRGLPRGSLAGHDVVAYEGEARVLHRVRLAGARADGVRVVFQTNSGAVHLRAVQASMGIAELPSYVGDAHHELVRVLSHHEMAYRVWLVVHRDLRRAARVRAVSDAIAASFRSVAV